MPSCFIPLLDMLSFFDMPSLDILSFDIESLDMLSLLILSLPMLSAAITPLAPKAKHIQAIFVTNTYPGGYWEDQGYNWFGGS